MYEIAWAKMLSLSFGSTTLAAGAVIAGFMGGMGIGAGLYHRLPYRRFNPLKLYGWLELGIASSAGVMTAGFYDLPELISSLPLGATTSLTSSFIRFGLLFALLLIPAALMGATFPALCTVMIHNPDQVDRRLGLIYGLNTIGAAVGAVLGGMVFIAFFGLTVTVRIANVLNVLVGLAAILVARRMAAGVSSAPDTTDTVIPTRLRSWLTGTVLLLSGMATLCYEILWFRCLRYSVGNSTYALTTVLVIFLLGLGLGALLLEYVVRRWSAEAALGISQCLIGVLGMCAVGSQWLLLSTPAIRDQIIIYSQTVLAHPWWLRLAIAALLAAGTMVPATILMGLSFPLASRLFLGDVRRIAARTGGAYLLANVGSVVGALAGAMLMLPIFGTIGGTKIVALVNVALGILVLGAAGMLGRRWPAALVAGAAVLVASLLLPKYPPLQGEPYDDPESEVVFVEEGDVGTVQVLQTPDRPDRRVMTIDGYKIGWSEGFEELPFYRKQVMLAYLPLVLEPRAQSVVNIGLASGATLDVLTQFEQLERILCVEISKSVVEANTLFVESRALNDPRVELIVDDAVHTLLRLKTQMDLIVSDGKENPYYAGSAAMLCHEFYEFSRRRLSPQGIFVQWTPLGMPHSDFRINLRTLCEVFEVVEVFCFPPGSVFVVGAKKPLTGRPWPRGRAFATSPAGSGCAAYSIGSLEALLAHWVTSRSALLQQLGDGALSTWDHMILDFSTYMTTPAEWSRARADNLELLLQCRERHGVRSPTFSPPPSPFVDSTQLIREAFLEHMMGRPRRAYQLARRAVMANPEDAAARATAAVLAKRAEAAIRQNRD